MADNGGNAADTLTIKVTDQLGAEVHFKIKKKTKLGKVIVAYCAKKSVDASTVRFLYDGERLNDELTPEELGMEDGDSIDMVIQQHGGSAM